MLTVSARADLRQDQGRHGRAAVAIQRVPDGKHSAGRRGYTRTLPLQTLQTLLLLLLLARGAVMASNLRLVVVTEEVAVVVGRRVASCRCNGTSCRHVHCQLILVSFSFPIPFSFVDSLFLFFRITDTDHRDAVSGYFNTGRSMVVVLRQANILVHSVILFLRSFGFRRSFCNRHR
jgi:hypothetical protein